MKRRCSSRDYSNPGIYMLTMTVVGRQRLLGSLQGDATAPKGTPSAPHIELSTLGQAVKEVIKSIPTYHPEIELWKHIVMEDHIHILIRVTKQLKRHLGLTVVAGVKASCNKAYWKHLGLPPKASNNDYPSLFEDGYHDRILLHKGQLKILQQYIEDNPRRLATKRQFPELFRQYLHIVIGEQEYAAFGNIFLLRKDLKVAVQVHRKDTAEEHNEHLKQWKQVIINDGVLVSPFISQREREVRDMARKLDGDLIILKENGFAEFFKPVGWEFDYCSAGHLLLLAPWPHHTEKSAITRSQCLQLNDMARDLCTRPQEEAHIKNPSK